MIKCQTTTPVKEANKEKKHLKTLQKQWLITNPFTPPLYI